MDVLAKNAYFWHPGGSKRGENEFLGKKRKRHVLILPKTKFHAKNQKIYRAVLWENLVRQREKETERDGPEYKGPPDAIAKPSDQKIVENETLPPGFHWNETEHFSHQMLQGKLRVVHD